MGILIKDLKEWKSNLGVETEKSLIESLSTIENINNAAKDDDMKIVNDIYDYLHSIKAEEGTPLDAAVKYFINVEAESKTFLLDGHIPISNNICERAIKPFAIMRRNVLFAKTEKGASIAGRIFTIVQTAKANALVVDKYLEEHRTNCTERTIDADSVLPD